MLNILKFLKRRDNKQKLIETLKLGVIGILILSVMRFSPFKLFYNHTSSMPIGWYFVNFAARDVKINDLVIACTPNKEMAELALKRDYILHSKYACNWGSEYLLKRVVAAPGDTVLVKNNQIYVNDKLLANSVILVADHLNQPLKSILQSATLDKNQYLLFGDTSSSFDSRYFGVVQRNNIKGKALPIYLKGINQ